MIIIKGEKKWRGESLTLCPPSLSPTQLLSLSPPPTPLSPPSSSSSPCLHLTCQKYNNSKLIEAHFSEIYIFSYFFIMIMIMKTKIVPKGLKRMTSTTLKGEPFNFELWLWETCSISLLLVGSKISSEHLIEHDGMWGNTYGPTYNIDHHQPSFPKWIPFNEYCVHNISKWWIRSTFGYKNLTLWRPDVAVPFPS